MKRSAPWILVGIALCACSARQAPEHAGTSQSGSSGEERGAADGYIFPGLEHGLSQSPINVITSASSKGTHSVKLHYQTSRESVTNLGHTIQVNYDKGSTLEFDGKLYDFKQFHFHTPSEHMIDGITYPMEVHMVHVLRGDPGAYLVVAFLFKLGERSAFLDDFIAAIPRGEGQTAVTGGSVDVSSMMDGDGDDSAYYHYEGSLTTPPYTETVTWGIIKHIQEASQDQIELFNALEGDNARHVQQVHDRVVDEN